MIVRSLILKLAQITDPRAKDTGDEFTESTILTLEGQRFTAQRLLDIYNMARVTMLTAAKEQTAPGNWKKSLGGAIVSTTISWQTAGTGVIEATKPTGFMFLESLSLNSGTVIYVLSPSMIHVVRRGVNPHYIQSSSNIFAFEIGTKFVHYGSFVPTTATNRIVYWGIADWTLQQAQGATTLETLNDRMYPFLIEVASAIARGQGAQEALSLAKVLIRENK